MENRINNTLELFEPTFKYQIIYAFEILLEPYKGAIKVGQTSLNKNISVVPLLSNLEEMKKTLEDFALKRIKQMTQTVSLPINLLHAELAIIEKKSSNGKVIFDTFKDKDVHQVLLNYGVKKFNPQGVQFKGKEWFLTNIETVKQAILAVKQGKKTIKGKVNITLKDYVLRQEQQEAIEHALKNFEIGDRELWNCKMRFGKTLTALELVKQTKYKKVLIFTHKPEVHAEWHQEFRRVFSNHTYTFASKKLKYTLGELLKENNPFIFFASIQDLRGSQKVGGKFNKNHLFFKTTWDFIILDEAHSGTKTILGDTVLKNLWKPENKKQNF